MPARQAAEARASPPARHGVGAPLTACSSPPAPRRAARARAAHELGAQELPPDFASREERPRKNLAQK
ncbi:Protein Disulfide-Isomerase A2 [Manis pentadactyla]|nr:Protein Disulfide-Isomerase A2 [Manis pentadactyla]